MKRIYLGPFSICTVAALFSLAWGCGEGEADPDAPNGGSGGSTAGSTSSGGAGGSTGGSGSSSGGSTAGGSGGSGGASAPSVCDAGKSGTHVLNDGEAFVDDFEDDVRFTGWYSYAAVPTAGTAATVMRVAGGAADTAMAASVANTGINTGTDKFGAGVGFNMRDAMDACADVSNFAGVSFWAKGTSGTSNTFKFLAVVPAASATMDGGDCTANCYNHPGKDITLTTEWTQYVIPWSELTGPVPITGNRILALQWITTGPDYEFAVDEVTLYKGATTDAPTGPVRDAAGAGGQGGGGN